METGDLTTAAKHLKVAVKRRTQEAYRHLGELYLQTYQFDEAAEMFEEYISLLTKKKQDTAPYEARLEIANKGSRWHGITLNPIIQPSTHAVWIDVHTPETYLNPGYKNEGELKAIDLVLKALQQADG